MSRPLVLLFGMPRSGTTWLGKIFDSHPDTLYRHEPDSRGTLNTLPMFPTGSDAEKYKLFLEEYVAKLPAIRDEKISASLPIFAKSYYTAPQLALRKLWIFSIKSVSRFLGSLPVPDVVNVAKRTKITLVWKSIESLGRLGVLARVFPDARCLLIFRHPCGYVSSVLRGEAKHKFESGTSSSEDWEIYRMLLALPAAKKRGLELDVVKAMLPVERLALGWALYYEHALTETTGLENVLVVRYEDFCEQPLEETKKVFSHCHLPWMPETECFIASSTSREDTAYYSVIKNPKIAASKWQKELTVDDVERIMRVVAQFQAGNYYSQSSE